MLKIRLLTDDPKLIDFASRYWQTDPETGEFIHRVTEIASEMGVTIRQAVQTISSCCTAFDDDALCPQCGEPVRVFASREGYLASNRQSRGRKHLFERTILCPACVQKADEERQAEAIQKKQEQAQRKVEFLRSLVGGWPRVVFDDLSLEQALFLTAYARAGLSENLEMLLSLEDIRDLGHKLAPTSDNEIEIVKSLKVFRLLEIHPTSPVDAVEDVLPEGGCSYFLEQVNWFFPASQQTPNEPGTLLVEIERAFIRGKWPARWEAEALALWQKIALWGCMEYLIFVLDTHGLPFSPGEKTIDLFKSLLVNYSTAQIYNFIWRAGKDAAAFYMRARVSKAHAANSVVNNIRRNAEHAIAMRWQVKAYRRDYNCPQSTVSQVLYDAILKLGDGGFETPPSNIELGFLNSV